MNGRGPPWSFDLENMFLMTNTTRAAQPDNETPVVPQTSRPSNNGFAPASVLACEGTHTKQAGPCLVPTRHQPKHIHMSVHYAAPNIQWSSTDNRGPTDKGHSPLHSGSFDQIQHCRGHTTLAIPPCVCSSQLQSHTLSFVQALQYSALRTQPLQQQLRPNSPVGVAQSTRTRATTDCCRARAGCGIHIPRMLEPHHSKGLSQASAPQHAAV